MRAKANGAKLIVVDPRRTQIASLARALIRRPSLLLLDEPFSSLDAPLRAKMRQELLKIKERFTIPVVLITHDPEDVAALAETVVVYEPGRVKKIISPTKHDYPVRGLPSLTSLATNLCLKSSRVRSRIHSQ
jgi:ABC-type sulfate/molybdate transport systems ATPase subunit